jgi:hypothetical protein
LIVLTNGNESTAYNNVHTAFSLSHLLRKGKSCAN